MFLLIKFLTDGNTKPNEIYSSWNLNSKESKHVKHLGIKKSTIIKDYVFRQFYNAK